MLRLFLNMIFFSLIQVCAANEPNSNEIESLIINAGNGDMVSQFKIASAYDTGDGVKRNGKEALKWYLLAANNGYAEAQNSVGSIYQAEKIIKML